MMSPELVKVLTVQNFINALETGQLDKASTYISDSFKFNAGGKAEFFDIQRRLRTAFPDRLLNPNVVEVNGDRVKVILQMTGTHKGDLALPIPGLEIIPPTGKYVSLPDEPTEYIVENDKIVEWVSRPGGFPEIFRQLGLELPPQLQTPAPDENSLNTSKSTRLPGELAAIGKTVFKLAEAFNPDEYVKYFTEDAVYKVGNLEPVVGREGIKMVSDSVAQVVKGISHNIKAMWEQGDTLMCEMDIVFTRHDNQSFTLPCLDILRIEGNLVAELQAYIDTSPVFSNGAAEDPATVTQRNLELAKEMYAGFKRGDIQPWLDALADDVTWELYGPKELELAGLKSGPEGVQQFLQTLINQIQVRESVQSDFIAYEDKVIILGRVKSTVKESGGNFESEYAHILTFRNGQLLSYREFLDTAQLLAAYRGN